MSETLKDGEDFYLERGFLVFTEAFLRRRGYCCESGCRHCPWGYSNKSRNDEPNPSPEGEGGRESG